MDGHTQFGPTNIRMGKIWYNPRKEFFVTKNGSDKPEYHQNLEIWICHKNLSRVVKKKHVALCKNKDADQLSSNCEADQRLCFYCKDSTILYFLNPKFSGSSHLLCLYSFVCVGPVRQPHCWFSHDAAHIRFDDGLAALPHISHHFRLGESTFIFRGFKCDFKILFKFHSL